MKGVVFIDNYVVYHLHDDTSNTNGYYDSCSKYNEYIKLATKQNMKAISFSNHGNIHDWIKKKQACDKAGLKYIHGVELYMCTELKENERGYHIGLYAKNYEGVKEINSLVSIATSKGNKEDKTDRHFYYNPRLSMDEVMSTSDNVIITTACLASFLWKSTINEYKLDYRDKFLEWMSGNNSRCFLEIQYHNIEDQILYNKMLHKWSQQYNIPLIAGTDTHSSSEYKAKCRLILQESQKKKNKNQKNPLSYEDNLDLVWKNYDEIIRAFEEQNALPKEVYMTAIKNTIRFSDMIENFDLDYSFKYPNLYGEDALDLWKRTIYKKLNHKVKNKIINNKRISEYKEKIKEEFEAMKKQGMESFMLFMSELVDFCNNNNIPYGFCRGSVGGSTIAYITDITDVDPLKWDTVFSRFCNAERVSLADIDIDFAPEDREKVYKYIIKRFTPKKTAYIAQFGTLKDRGTIDALARGLHYEDLDLVSDIKNRFDDLFDRYSKIIQEEVNIEELEPAEARSIDFDYHDIYIDRIRKNNKKKKADSIKQDFEMLKEENEDLFYYFDGMKGTIISKGNHPAGIIGSPITLQDNLGVFYKKGDESMPVSQCAMKSVDSVNYVKFDILGLKTVGILKDAYEYIDSHYLKSHEINWNDEKVWNNMITSQVGCFQFEGNYAFNLLKQFEPQAINDMSLVNAALRPSGKSYRDRLIKKEFNKNPSEEIDKLLSKNYGYLVYQEDTIKFLTDICDFSGSLADTTRRAIGKKDYDLLHEQLPKILNGYCNHSNKSRDIAEKEAKEFIQIVDDSSEYQFGYNHSTGYSMNGYACVRLRTYYPLEFTTAYLNRADKTKHKLLGTNLAKQLNIKLNPIRFRKSRARYSFDRSENAIYKGIESIKFCNKQIADELYELGKNKYNNFIELLYGIKSKTSVDFRQLKILTGLDFFREFGRNKKLLDIIDIFENLYSRKQMNSKNINKFNIDEKLLSECSGKITEKLYKEIDWISYMSKITDRMEDKPLSVKEQVKFEIDYLEYTRYKNPKVSDKFYIVTEITIYGDKTKPYVTLRHVKTGIDMKSKVTASEKYIRNPFKLYSVLKVNEFEHQVTRTGNEWDVLDEWEVY